MQDLKLPHFLWKRIRIIYWKMKLEERVAEATNDKKLKNDLIGEYQNFILAAASKVLKRSVTTSDDEYIIAMVAFGDAIDGYNENKGNFLS